jgi:hypothetical protein
MSSARCTVFSEAGLARVLRPSQCNSSVCVIHGSNHTGRVLICPLFDENSQDYPLILYPLEKYLWHDNNGILVTAKSLSSFIFCFIPSCVDISICRHLSNKTQSQCNILFQIFSLPDTSGGRSADPRMPSFPGSGGVPELHG